MFILSLTLVSAVPRIEPYVNDFANILTSEEETNLNLYLDLIEQNTSWEIAVITLQNTEGQERVEYANKIGDENGVGKKDQDNGIVILYSLEEGGAIATGRYSESIFNDAKVGRIGRNNKHFFTKGEYYNGFEGIIKELEQEIESPIKQSATENNSDGFWVILFIFGILPLIFLINILTNSRENSDDSESSTNSTHNSSYSGSSRGSSSPSFGGGSFGGGGSSF